MPYNESEIRAKDIAEVLSILERAKAKQKAKIEQLKT